MKKTTVFLLMALMTLSTFAQEIKSNRSLNSYMAHTELQNKDKQPVILRLNHHSDNNYYLHIIVFKKKMEWSNKTQKGCTLNFKGKDPVQLKFSNKRDINDFRKKGFRYAYKYSYQLGKTKEESLEVLKGKLKTIEYKEGKTADVKKIKIKNKKILQQLLAAVKEERKKPDAVITTKKIDKISYTIDRRDTTKEAFIQGDGKRVGKLPLVEGGKIEIYHAKVVFFGKDGKELKTYKLYNKQNRGHYMGKPIIDHKFKIGYSRFELKQSPSGWVLVEAGSWGHKIKF